MVTNTKHSWGWAALFGLLAASNVAQLFLGAGHAPGLALAAIGFSVVALVALYSPRGLLAVSWRQLSAPRELGTRNLVSVVAVALLVVGTAMQW
ncbi:MAG TPA: hypothetical protein VLZ55_05000, partial [Rhodanobacter sp.]|nr:hypothetical protein [Rhodanobacter sp.]